MGDPTGPQCICNWQRGKPWFLEGLYQIPSISGEIGDVYYIVLLGLLYHIMYRDARKK